MPQLASFYGIVIWMTAQIIRPRTSTPSTPDQLRRSRSRRSESSTGHFPLVRCDSCANGLNSMQRSWPRTGSGRRRSSHSSRSNPWRSIGSVLRVTDAQPLDSHQLRVEFNDGSARDVDCSFLLHGTLGEPLRDLDYFRQVRVDDEARTIVWPNGLDPAPELLHGDYDALDPGAPPPRLAADSHRAAGDW